VREGGVQRREAIHVLLWWCCDDAIAAADAARRTRSLLLMLRVALGALRAPVEGPTARLA
jgi:hypothetical protein